MFLETVFTPGLSHLSYLIGDASAGVAAVIDPRRDVQVYLDLARRHGVRITHALETHIHADFVSGSRELADRVGAEIHAGAEEAEYGFDVRGLAHGDTVEIGAVRLGVLHTPGHTPEHVCFQVSGGTGSEAPWGVFTGDTLFAGEVGRPDLLGDGTEEPLARRLFHSLHEVLLPLGDGLQVLPAHGKGSPCGASIGDRRTTTLGYERRNNPRLRFDDRDRFVRDLLESGPETPDYYARVKRTNAEGPRVLGAISRVQPIAVETLERERVLGDAVVLDTREIEAWGGAHIEGSLNIALRDAFPIWAGWLLHPDRRILLVPERAEDVDRIQRHLLRVGIEGLSGYLARGFRAWTEAGRPFRRTRQLSVHELRGRIETGREGGDALQVLDVRGEREWRGGHVPTARHAFVGRVGERRGDIDPERPVAVYCGSGYRASMAASLLEQAGVEEVLNVPGSIGAWQAAGYELEEE